MARFGLKGPKTSARTAGMTLVELVVTIGVLLTMTAIGLTATVAASRHAAVRASANEVSAFLRQTAGYALNGVKAPGCAPVTDPRCSQYRVEVASLTQLQRDAVGDGDTIYTYTLPRDVEFFTPTGPPSSFTIRYTPPVLRVIPPQIQTIGVRHIRGSPERNICVTPLGGIETRTGACTP